MEIVLFGVGIIFVLGLMSVGFISLIKEIFKKSNN